MANFNRTNPFDWGVSTQDVQYISQPTQRNAKYSTPIEGKEYNRTQKESFVRNEGNVYPQLAVITAIDEPQD